MLGLNVPVDKDYLAIAKKVTLNNIKRIKQAVQLSDYEPMQSLDHVSNYYQEGKGLVFNYNVLGKDYILPCRELYNFDCINKVVAQGKLLNLRMADNKVLLDRYSHIIKLPYYDGYYMTISSSLPDYGGMIRLSELRMAKAILLINEDNVTDGLNILKEEIAFYKKILAGRDSLIGPMVAVRQLFTLYHVVAELLDRPELASYLTTQLVKSLVAPLTTDEQQAVARSLQIERNGMLYLYLTLPNEDKLPLWAVFYDKNASANKAYQQFAISIKLAQLTLPEASALAIAKEKNLFSIKRLMQEKGLFFLRNYYGEVLLNTGKVSYTNYSNRLYDLVIYLSLVNTKLQIKQMGLTKGKIADWLVAHKVVNPYSHKSISWSLDDQCLTTDWLDETKVNNERWGTKQATIYIAF